MTASLIVLDIEGLSIRTAGCYGNVEIQTPLLNEFAAQARVFEQHYRALVDPVRDRDLLFSLLSEEFESALMLANAYLESSHEVTQFGSADELAGLLEDRFDTRNHAAVIHLRSEPDDEIDSHFPLSLITQLIEAEVDVVVTSTSPLADLTQYSLRNEEAIRVPLMIWSLAADRVQSVTSSHDLIDLVHQPPDRDGSAVIQSDAMAALRQPGAMLLATRDLLAEVKAVDTEQLADSIDVNDERLQLFRKPDDVWNVHNVLVEDIQQAAAMLVQLRAEV